MSADALLSVCVLMLPAVVIWFLWAYVFGRHRGRRQSVRMQQEAIALRAGETFVGVIEGDTGPSIFIVYDATDGTNNA
jgi:hypothetical protein